MFIDGNGITHWNEMTIWSLNEEVLSFDAVRWAFQIKHDEKLLKCIYNA
jgi:hypothetical protein